MERNNSDTWCHIYENSGFGNRYPLSYLVGLFHTRIKPKLLKHKPLHEMKVLDFACSIGANSVIFKNLGVEVFGIDVSEKAIEKCIQGGGINLGMGGTLRP